MDFGFQEKGFRRGLGLIQVKKMVLMIQLSNTVSTNPYYQMFKEFASMLHENGWKIKQKHCFSL